MFDDESVYPENMTAKSRHRTPATSTHDRNGDPSPLKPASFSSQSSDGKIKALTPKAFTPRKEHVHPILQSTSGKVATDAIVVADSEGECEDDGTILTSDDMHQVEASKLSAYRTGDSQSRAHKRRKRTNEKTADEEEHDIAYIKSKDAYMLVYTRRTLVKAPSSAVVNPAEASDNPAIPALASKRLEDIYAKQTAETKAYAVK